MMKDLITPIKDQLDEQMMHHCALFVTIGNGGTESPRWYNYREFDPDSNMLTIGSTQKSSLFFTVDCKKLDVGFVSCDEFWSQFKEYRTEFLRTNFKTIETA